MRQMERRSFRADELRVAKKGDTRTLVGHAAVFNQWSEDLGWFREKVAPGAFAETIQKDDIRGLWNHDANHVLGRNTAGTLRLAEDDIGLSIEIDLPDTQIGRDLGVSVERGDVSQMSFAFRTLSDQWFTEDGIDSRILTKVMLYDVAPVTYAAYPQTDLGLRTLLEERAGIDVDALARVIFRARQGLPARAADVALVETVWPLLERVAGRSAAPSGGRIDDLRRWLDRVGA